MNATSFSRERQELLRDLRRQLPNTAGPLRKQTERAIERLEIELAGGRGIAGEAATR